MRGVPAARVRNGERLVGREQPEHDERHAETEQDRVQRRQRVGRAEEHAGGGDQQREDDRGDADAPAHATCRRETRDHRADA